MPVVMRVNAGGIMNAQTRNSALTAAFKYGGRGDVLLGLGTESESEESRQSDKEEAHRIMVKGLKSFGNILECPCGCGLKEEICEAHLAKIALKNAEIPY